MTNSQLLLSKHKRECGRYTPESTYQIQAYSVHKSNGFMIFRGQLEVDLRLSCLSLDFFVCMDGHPQATVVLSPCSLVTLGCKGAAMGITVCLLLCLFSCSMECGKRGERCMNCLSHCCMVSVGLMHNLSKVTVIPYSAGNSRLSWRCQLSANECVQDIQDILRIPPI